MEFRLKMNYNDHIEPIVVIKRPPKKLETLNSHANNGTWKVAYADFITAMMVFFLLLWILNENNKSVAIAEYFSDPEAYEAAQIKKKPPQQINISVNNGITSLPNTGTSQSDNLGKSDIINRLQLAFKSELADEIDQVLVDIYGNGIRIQITDKEGGEMFSLGSANPTERAKKILKIVTAGIKPIPGNIIIEGHTDTAQYKNGAVTNWELSSSRAAVARKLVQEYGIEASRIDRITGYADKQLLLPQDGTNKKNRRISIIISADTAQSRNAYANPPKQAQN